jgi:HlyD family secretion protein
MHTKLRRILPVAIILILLAAAGAWYWLSRANAQTNGAITASGTVEAVVVIISPEISGRVIDVLVVQGESVSAGQALIKLDDTLLQAQRKLAEAGRTTALAGLDSARAALETARTQYEQVLETARLAEAPARTASLASAQPSDFEQPIWYFSKDEQIAAMQAEVDAARIALEAEQNKLKELLQQPVYTRILAAEQRLAQARAAYLTTQDALTAAYAAGESELVDAAQETFDDAKSEIMDAQGEYADLLDSDLGKDLLKARARVRAAEERYQSALVRLARLHTGEDSYAVKLAASAVLQADAAATQAEKAADQTRAQLDSIDAQIGRLTIYAPADGTVLERNLEPGEVAVAGSTALVLGQLDTLTITVYIPEDRYGEIQLGGAVEITVDSFPGRIFTGSVTRIAEKAQFTPRNVQTEEGRRTTVFAVEITLRGADSGLKPGMPADVVFE